MSHVISGVPWLALVLRDLTRVLCVSLLALNAPLALAQKISIEADKSVDFGKFSTFAIKEGRLNSRSPALNSDLTKKRIASEIEKNLTAKGLTASTGPADLTVSFEFGSSRELETKTLPAGPRGMGTRVVNVPQSEGVLVIDLYDSSTNSMVWRGTAGDSEANPLKLADKLDNMVKKAIAKYPGKKNKNRGH